MSKKILAFILAACMTLSMTACGGSDSSDAETQSSSFSETDSSENNSSETDSSEDESSETNSSETDSSEDESSEVEKVTTKTPKKVEDSSSEDDNSSKVTTTKKTETPKTTTTTKTTQAPVTQKPATTTKTTTKKPTTTTTVDYRTCKHKYVTSPEAEYTDASGQVHVIKVCEYCGHWVDELKKTTQQSTSKTVQPNEWIPVYNKTFVTHTIGDGYTFHYDPKTQSAVPDKKVEFISKTYWSPAAVSRGDAVEIAKRDKANAEADAFMSRKDLMNKGWVSSGNDHYIDVPDKYDIAFYYYKDSNGKYAVAAGSIKPSVTTESDLTTKTDCYKTASKVKTLFQNAYFTGTPWA